MKKKLFAFSIFLIFLIFFYSIKDCLLLGIIQNLLYIKDKAGKLYIRGCNFQVIDDEKGYLSPGDTEKYLLRDSNGNAWLFKLERDIEKPLVTYALANILGINTPAQYSIKLNINGIEKSGIIQQIIDSKKDIYVPQTLIGRHDLIPSIIITEIFCSMTYFDSEDIELLLTKSDKLYLIDLNNSFDFTAFTNNIDREECYLEIDKLKDTNINFHNVFIFLKHIENMNDEWLRKTIKRTIGDYKIQDKIDYLIDMWIEREKIILKETFARYSVHPCFSIARFSSLNHFSYRINICKQLTKDIIKNTIDLIFKVL